MNDPLAVSVDQACRLIGIKRTLLYSLLGAQRLTKCKVGRRTLVTVASINKMLLEAAEMRGR